MDGDFPLFSRSEFFVKKKGESAEQVQSRFRKIFLKSETRRRIKSFGKIVIT